MNKRPPLRRSAPVEAENDGVIAVSYTHLPFLVSKVFLLFV